MAQIPDSQRFSYWSQHAQYSGLPRVLLFTWCTEDSYLRYVNETYWKLCYAQVHGFQVVFTDEMKDVNGVKRWNGTSGEEHDTDRLMWAWAFAIKPYLLSGEYDYVFVLGADVLINSPNLHFPAWALDTGHDLTLMDQHFDSWGLNANGMLFRPTRWSVQFIDDMLSHRGDFNIQGDNGPFMEAILMALGREASEAGKPGYKDTCRELLKIPQSAAHMSNSDQVAYTKFNEAYSKCFFYQLEQMTGNWNSRSSKHIGFSPTHGTNMLPWANCWSEVRARWEGWQKNCLTIHWNGYKGPGYQHSVTGQCADAAFDWSASPYNPVNRKKGKDPLGMGDEPAF